MIAALAGLVAGFVLANSINRTELSTLRAENEQLKKAPAAAPGSSGGNLTQEEIDATIARADQNPGDFLTQRNVGIAIYRYGAVKQDQNLIRQSVRILDRAVALRPDDYEVILSLGNANFDIGYFAKENQSLVKARDFYAKALAAKPDNVDVRTDVGLTYFLETPPDYAKAETEFRRSLDKDPKHEKTLQYMVQALIKQSKSAEAADYLQRLRTVNPQNESIGELTSMLSTTAPAG